MHPNLNHYLRVLKRMWPVIVGLTFLGAVAGWLSTPEAADTGGIEYYKATTTLLADERESARTNSDLFQAELLANTGDVPERVAEQLGLPENEVADHVQGEAFPERLALLVTGLDTDPERARLLSEASANQLIQYLTERNDADLAQQTEAVTTRLRQLDEQIAELDAQLQAGPSDPIAESERDSLINQRVLQRERLSQLSQDPSAAGLSVVEPAEPVEISADAYAFRLQRIAQGPQTNSGAAPTTIPTDEAEAPNGPPDPTLRTVAGGLLGLALGIGVVLALDRFDTRLRTKDDVEEAFGLPVIAQIPPLSRSQRSSNEVLAVTEPRSRFAEAHRVMRTSVLFVRSIGRPKATTSGGNGAGNGNGAGAELLGNGTNGTNGANGDHVDTSGTDDGMPELVDKPVPVAGAGDRARVIMVTSPGPDDGKTTTVANLASVLAESGLSVLVINCDFRRPRVQKLLEPAKTKVLFSDESARVEETIVPRVRLVTGFGERDASMSPAEVVAKQIQVIEVARSQVDVILLDTAPVLTTNDAADLLPESDLVLLVAQTGKTKWEAASRTSELLGRLDARVLGVVLTNSSDSASNYNYYYYYLDKSGKRVGRAASKAKTPEVEEVVDLEG